MRPKFQRTNSATRTGKTPAKCVDTKIVENTMGIYENTMSTSCGPALAEGQTDPVAQAQIC